MPPINEAQNAHTVTNADGVKYRSNHQGGRALDIVPLDAQDQPQWPPATDIRWQMIAVVMKQFGFAWGGDWTKEKDGIDPDLPHYEMV